MSHFDLFDAVARKTGEDSHEIRRRGFVLEDSHDSGACLDHDPDCLFDLIDLPETGTVDWDEVLTDAGYACREPFYASTLKARRKKRTTIVKPGSKKQGAQAARPAAGSDRSKISRDFISDGRGVWWMAQAFLHPRPSLFHIYIAESRPNTAAVISPPP